jgi:hypothetical protein
VSRLNVADTAGTILPNFHPNCKFFLAKLPGGLRPRNEQDLRE